MKNNPIIGIDDMSLYVPNLYFDIKELAEARNIEYAKLNKGLGLTQMAITDSHEDAATMSANAILELIQKNNLKPEDIGRIYLGTESALDGAKPTATYTLQMLQDYFADEYGKDCFLHCDVIDMTFACIGGIDALNNTIDWVRADVDRIGIVVSADIAKYELASSGEYTQGAGAVAMLVKANPRLIAIADVWGVACMGVHDFFKPLRHISKQELIAEVMQWAGKNGTDIQAIEQKTNASLETNGVIDTNQAMMAFHKVTPVFDGQFSNQCYQDRIHEAYHHFRKKAVKKGMYQEKDNPSQEWERLIFHLPYAFHGRRIFSHTFAEELKRTGEWDTFIRKNGISLPKRADFDDDKSFQKAQRGILRTVSKTLQYRQLVKNKIAPSEWASSLIGNMYAGSIFLALMGTLEHDQQNDSFLKGKKLGFFAYGSGSKSKVFEGEVQEGWKEVAARFNITSKLEQRTKISYDKYQSLHTGYHNGSHQHQQGAFKLSSIGKEGVLAGARYYEWGE